MLRAIHLTHWPVAAPDCEAPVRDAHRCATKGAGHFSGVAGVVALAVSGLWMLHTILTRSLVAVVSEPGIASAVPPEAAERAALLVLLGGVGFVMLLLLEGMSARADRVRGRLDEDESATAR